MDALTKGKLFCAQISILIFFLINFFDEKTSVHIFSSLSIGVKISSVCEDIAQITILFLKKDICNSSIISNSNRCYIIFSISDCLNLAYKSIFYLVPIHILA